MAFLSRQRLGSFPADRRGVAALEFALIAPVILVLLFGTMRAGHALGVQHALSQLAADAARAALPEASAPRREAIVRRYVSQSADTYPLLSAERVRCSIDEDGERLTVLVTMNVSHIPTVPILSAVYEFPQVQSASAVIGVQR